MLGLSIAGRAVSRIAGDAMDAWLPPFPPSVRIETTNHCQAACTFCPRDSIGRAKTFMEEDLYRSVIAQCVEGGCRTIHVHGFGEPLLDKKLPERIRYAKDAGIKRVKMFSNGALLKGELAQKILDSGLDQVKISIDGSDSKEFNLLRVGLDYDKVLANVIAFRKLRDDAGREKPRIVAATCQTSNRAQTRRMLAGVVDRIDFTHIHNWGGKLGMLTGQRVRKPCDRLWRTFSVLVNGDVALCCLDFSGKEILGNLHREPIVEIWKNARYRQLRKLHRLSQQEQIPLCSNCSKCFF